MEDRLEKNAKFKENMDRRFRTTLGNLSGSPPSPVVGPQLAEDNSRFAEDGRSLYLHDKQEYVSVFPVMPPSSSPAGVPSPTGEGVSPVSLLSPHARPLTSLPTPSSAPRRWLVLYHVRNVVVEVEDLANITPSLLRSVDVDKLRDLVPCDIYASDHFGPLLGGKVNVCGTGPASFTSMSCVTKGSHHFMIPSTSIAQVISRLHSSGACKSLQIANPHLDDSLPVGFQAFKRNCESLSCQVIAGLLSGRDGVVGLNTYGGKDAVFHDSRSRGEKYTVNIH